MFLIPSYGAWFLFSRGILGLEFDFFSAFKVGQIKLLAIDNVMTVRIHLSP